MYEDVEHLFTQKSLLPLLSLLHQVLFNVNFKILDIYKQHY